MKYEKDDCIHISPVTATNPIEVLPSTYVPPASFDCTHRPMTDDNPREDRAWYEAGTGKPGKR